jgi:hypothetical protein
LYRTLAYVFFWKCTCYCTNVWSDFTFKREH